MVVAAAGMGGLNSPAIAHMTHLEVLRHGGIDTSPFLRWGFPLPNSSLLTGVFYDDLVVAAIVPTSKAHSLDGPDADLTRKALVAYHSACLPPSPGKGFGFGGTQPDKEGVI